MKPRLYVVDDFFTDPEYIRSEVLQKEHTDLTSPIDNITYHGINMGVPHHINVAMRIALRRLFGKEIKVKYCFSRLRTSRMKPTPNNIHSDRTMSQYAAHIYLSEVWPDGSGTSFWKNKQYDMEEDVGLTEEQAETIRAQTNDRSYWTLTNRVAGKYNRFIVHDSTLFHSADPFEGFGDNINDGRLVVTMFFDLEE